MSKKSASGLFIQPIRTLYILTVRAITSYKMPQASVYHALVVIFLEFFSWGLLTSPMISALNETFPDQTFLMNGFIVGVKGFLSFLSAPLVGALSDKWGRKYFLLVTVLFTCSPIPLMAWNKFWFFLMISLSGLFAVTFSVVFAYVADVTTDQDRSWAYGMVSATFAASLVISPALGAYLSAYYGDGLVVAIASLTALADIVFICFFVPESLPLKTRKMHAMRDHQAGDVNIWEVADPFSSLKKVGKDRMIRMLCIAVFLSYLPEAGQYSCFFVYLRLVIGFTSEQVALYIAVVGLLSVLAQTTLLSMFMNTFNAKNTIIIGLMFEAAQLSLYGFGSQPHLMWFGGVLAAISSITYPAISSYVSTHADSDRQGAVQGMITGIRGLCNGLGPAFFGLIFSLFHVDLSHDMVSHPVTGIASHLNISSSRHRNMNGDQLNHTIHGLQSINTESVMPGPPFAFGALMVILAVLVTAFIPHVTKYKIENLFFPDGNKKGASSSSQKGFSNYYYTNIKHTEQLNGGSTTTTSKLGDPSPLLSRKQEDKKSDDDDEFEYEDPMSSSPEDNMDRDDDVEGDVNPGVRIEKRKPKNSYCEFTIPLISDSET